MREQDMNQGRNSEMLRSTGKNGQKRNVSGPFGYANHYPMPQYLGNEVIRRNS